MIKPTIGRQVWHWPQGSDPLNPEQQPEAATVVYVWSDVLVNVRILDHGGVARSEMKVQLRQPEDIGQPALPFCEWMPFQVGQAKPQSSS